MPLAHGDGAGAGDRRRRPAAGVPRPGARRARSDWLAALEQEAERRLARGETGILDALGRQFERALITQGAGAHRRAAHRGGQPARHGPQHHHPQDPGARHRGRQSAGQARRAGRFSGCAGLTPASACAFLRFASSCASTSATSRRAPPSACPSARRWSAPGGRRARCWARRRQRARGGRRACRATCAAAAYFSNGTRSFSSAPSETHSFDHPVVDRARGVEVAVHRLLDRAHAVLRARSGSCRRAASPISRAARTSSRAP